MEAADNGLQIEKNTEKAALRVVDLEYVRCSGTVLIVAAEALQAIGLHAAHPRRLILADKRQALAASLVFVQVNRQQRGAVGPSQGRI